MEGQSLDQLLPRGRNIMMQYRRAVGGTRQGDGELCDARSIVLRALPQLLPGTGAETDLGIDVLYYPRNCRERIFRHQYQPQEQFYRSISDYSGSVHLLIIFRPLLPGPYNQYI